MANNTPVGVSNWETRVADKQNQVLSTIPPEFIHSQLSHSLNDTSSVQDIPEKFLSPLELAITSLDAPALIATIASGKYTSVQVLNAFTHRAVIAHKLLNCCLMFPYESALERAKGLDDFLAKEGKTRGELHGLPISVKDQCRVIGTETTCGFVSNLGKIDEQDSLLVKILQDAGAVVFTKTNLSVGCMWGETINNIIGTTSNPFNRSFSCGGSSGGEGALVGIHGSPMGIGSDLGGSIRSPSAYQGLWGLRPSSGRIPYHNILNSMEGQETIASVVGPMSHSPESLALFSKVVIDARPWLTDPKVHPIPWHSDTFSEATQAKKLKIGVMHWDGNVLPQPPIRAALKELEARLKAAGHEVIPWKVDQKKALELMLRVFSSDATADINRTIALSGEPVLNLITHTAEKKTPISLIDSWQLACERLAFQASVLKDWEATSQTGSSTDVMDAYITPVNPSIAPKHGDYARVRYLGYTGTVNVLDFTACTIPVGFVTAEHKKDAPSMTEDAEGQSIPAKVSDLDGLIRENYEPEVYKGLPITVQIVGRRLEEEKVLGMAHAIRDLLQDPYKGL